MDETLPSRANGTSIANRTSVLVGPRPSRPHLAEPSQVAESFKDSRKVQQSTDPGADNYSFKHLP